jgi:hypothetical protein
MILRVISSKAPVWGTTIVYRAKKGLSNHFHAWVVKPSAVPANSYRPTSKGLRSGSRYLTLYIMVDAWIVCYY